MLSSSVGQPGVDLVTEDDDVVSPADLCEGLQLGPVVHTAAGVAGVGQDDQERSPVLTRLPDAGLEVLGSQLPLVFTMLWNEARLVAGQPR